MYQKRIFQYTLLYYFKYEVEQNLIKWGMQSLFNRQNINTFVILKTLH